MEIEKNLKVKLTIIKKQKKMNNIKRISNINQRGVPQQKSNVSLVENSNKSTNVLNVFNIKLIKDHIFNAKVENNKNFAGKPKHYPPANKEWFNSVYSYNKNATKLLPAADEAILKLVKSYFNLYSRKLERKIKSVRLRLRARRLSTNRILVGRPEIKHTNDKVTITIYIYNRQKKYYLNKIKKIASIDQINNLIPNRLKKRLIRFNGSWPSNLKLNLLRNKSLKLKLKVEKHKSIIWKTLNLKSITRDNIFKNYETKFLKGYVYRSLRKEILSVYFRQLLFFNKSKFEETYLLPLTGLARRVYNKEILFNLVELKYLYLDSYIFSETLVTKLRNRKNRLIRVLKASLLMFILPAMDRKAVYNQIYNRKRKLQNIKVHNNTSIYTDLQINNKMQLRDKDALELSLSEADSNNSILKLKNYTTYRHHDSMYFNYPLYIANTILRFVKHKYVSGVRIEVAGRLTKRNTAARSVFKLRYKGNIKNMDSSYKGLPSVLLRGYAKSNLQYTILKSRIRIGSFGLKGWVSSS